MPKPKKRVRNKSTGRNYKKEYKNYQGSKEQITRRSSRNKARRVVAKRKGVKPTQIKGDVAHKNGNPKSNGSKNLAVQSKSKNRSFARTKKAKKKNRRS